MTGCLGLYLFYIICILSRWSRESQLRPLRQIYIYIYTQTHTHIHMNHIQYTYTDTDTNTNTYTYTFTYIYICICMYIYICTHVETHIYNYNHIYRERERETYTICTYRQITNCSVNYPTYITLVGGCNPSEKYEFVRLDHHHYWGK